MPLPRSPRRQPLADLALHSSSAPTPPALARPRTPASVLLPQDFVSLPAQPLLPSPLSASSPSSPSQPSAWAARHFASLLTPDPLQAEILDCANPRLALLCARQWGKSTVLALKALHHALHHPRHNLLITSPAIRQSTLLLDKVARFAANLPCTYSRRGDALTFANGSSIRALPGSPDTIRGFSAIHVLIIDDAAFASDSLFHAVLPFLATTNGHLWLASTPSGQSGFFYEICTQADSPFARFTATAPDCPRIAPAFLAQERAAKSATQFAQDYLCQFLPSKGQLFDAALLHAAPQTTHGSLAPTLLFGLDIGFHQSHTALAVLHLSWSPSNANPNPSQPHLVLRHLERFPLATAHTEVWASLAALIQAQTQELLHLGPPPSRILVFDYAGAGQVYCEHFRAHSQNLHLLPVTISSGPAAAVKSDYITVPRRELLNTLKALLESGQLQIPASLANRAELVAELMNLSHHSQPQGSDDLAIAVALAAYQANQAITNRPSLAAEATARSPRKTSAQAHSQTSAQAHSRNTPAAPAIANGSVKPLPAAFLPAARLPLSARPTPLSATGKRPPLRSSPPHSRAS